MRLVSSILLGVVSACSLGTSVCSAQLQAPGPSGQIFLDNYDGYTVQTGSAPYDYYTSGNLAAVGVTNAPGSVVSGNALFVGVNFSSSSTTGGQTAFGGGLNDTLEGKTFNLTGTTLSASVQSSAGPAPEGYFAFRIVDGAGNAYRSALFNPGSSFTTISAPVSSFVDNTGSGTINLANITEIDLVAYNLGDNVVTTLDIDDFQGVVVPEPATYLAGMLCLVSGLIVVYQRRPHISQPQ